MYTQLHLDTTMTITSLQRSEKKRRFDETFSGRLVKIKRICAW